MTENTEAAEAYEVAKVERDEAASVYEAAQGKKTEAYKTHQAALQDYQSCEASQSE